MKKITLLVAIFVTSLLSAQTTYFEDDFNDQDISDWTLLDEDGDGNNWGDTFQITSNNDSGGTDTIVPPSLISRSWTGPTGALTPNNYAISPAIDLSDANSDETLTLSWIRRVNSGFPGETYTAYVGTSDDIEDLQETDIQLTENLPEEPSEETDTPMEITLDVSDLAGEETVYIAFRHYDSEDFDYISLDNVKIVSGSFASVSDQNIAGFNYYFDTQNTLHLSAQKNFEHIEVYNMLGARVNQQELNSNEAQINLSNLSAGVYIGKATVAGAQQSFKFVIK